MTALAWDGVMVAADRLCVSNRKSFCNKLFAFEGQVLCTTGDEDFGMQRLAWYCNDADTASWPDAFNSDDHALYVFGDGWGLKFYRTPYPSPIETFPFATGSAGPVLMGAMLAGKSAHDAVLIANQVDPNCGLGVQVMYAQAKTPSARGQRDWHFGFVPAVHVSGIFGGGNEW